MFYFVIGVIVSLCIFYYDVYIPEPMHAGETQVTFYMKHAVVPTELKAEVTAAYVSVQGNNVLYLSHSVSKQSSLSPLRTVSYFISRTVAE